MNRASQNQNTTMLFAVSGVLLVAALVYFSLSSNIVELPGDRGGHVAHVGAYALLMFVATRISRDTRFAAIAGFGLFALGIAIEFLQAQTGYRHYERADMLANAVGIACGWLAGWPFTAAVRRARR